MGVDDAIEGANIYLWEGVDIAFVESPLSLEDLKRIGKEVRDQKVANMVERGNTSLLKTEELQKLDFSIVIFQGTCVHASVRAI